MNAYHVNENSDTYYRFNDALNQVRKVGTGKSSMIQSCVLTKLSIDIDKYMPICSLFKRSVKNAISMDPQ